ncbi:MAG: ferrous iron transport protein A [Acetanaerobacterium sp.]
MPLTMASVGTENQIRHISGRDDTRRYLESLGFVEGERITVVSELGGNMIVNVKGSRVAINKGMAGRIMI